MSTRSAESQGAFGPGWAAASAPTRRRVGATVELVGAIVGDLVWAGVGDGVGAGVGEEVRAAVGVMGAKGEAALSSLLLLASRY